MLLLDSKSPLYYQLAKVIIDEIIKEIGPDHNKTFEAEVKVEGKILATGIGKSKKQAEMEAAKKALESINN